MTLGEIAAAVSAGATVIIAWAACKTIPTAVGEKLTAVGEKLTAVGEKLMPHTSTEVAAQHIRLMLCIPPEGDGNGHVHPSGNEVIMERCLSVDVESKKEWLKNEQDKGRYPDVVIREVDTQ
jgi:hypothetical protein